MCLYRWYIIWKWFVRIGCTIDGYIYGRDVWSVPLRVHWVVKKKELVGVPECLYPVVDTWWLRLGW